MASSWHHMLVDGCSVAPWQWQDQEAGLEVSSMMKKLKSIVMILLKGCAVRLELREGITLLSFVLFVVVLIVTFLLSQFILVSFSMFALLFNALTIILSIFRQL